MRRDRRRASEPVPLRDAMEAVGRELGLPAPDATAALLAAWPEVVGDELAAHARLRSVRAGVCTVEVDDAGWATRLRYGERQLIERANACCGGRVVTAVRVVMKGSATAVP